MDKYILPVCSSVFADSKENQQTFNASLPEYQPNIKKILKTDTYAYSEKAIYDSGKISVFGKLCAKILYVSDNQNHFKSASFEFDISESFDASKINLSDASPVIEAKMCVLFSQATPRNARSIDLKVTVKTSAEIHNCTEINLLSSDNSDLELLSDTGNVVIRHMLSSNGEPVNKEFSLPEDATPVAEIVSSNVCTVLEDVLTKDGLIEYKAKAIFKCTYRTENDEADIYGYFTDEFDFSGEIPFENAKDISLITGKIAVCKLDTSVNSDPYGENKIISLNMTYEIVLDAFEETDFEYAKDGFCQGYECDFTYKDITYDSSVSEINEHVSITEVFGINNYNVNKITDSDIRLCSENYEFSEGVFYAKALATLDLCGVGQSGEMEYATYRLNLRIPLKSITDNGQRNKYILNISVSKSNAEISDGQIHLYLKCEINGVQISHSKISAIVGADIKYDLPKPLCNSEFIIYYPEKDEDLWEIAKKYEISAKLLEKANDNNQDKNRFIIIPCKI